MDLSAAIDQFRGPLIGLIISWGAPHADAADIAQDCFADGWVNRGSCRGDLDDPTVYGKWLRGIAKNKYRTWARSKHRREKRVAIVGPDQLFSASKDHDESTEELILLRIAIEKLPAKQRQVILMHYLEQTSVKAVAAVLSVSEKTIEGRLYQARRRLRQMLSESRSAESQIGKALLL